MTRIITILQEPMDASEIAYLQHMRSEQLPMLRRTIRIFAMGSVVLPVILGIMMAVMRAISPKVPRPNGEPPPNIFIVCLFGMIGMMLLLGIATYFSYARTMGRISKDIRSGLKIVEKSEVVRKLYMKENNTYHFYLNSPTRLSIEVDAEDYENFEPGDEVNIEYTPRAKIYFGYY